MEFWKTDRISTDTNGLADYASQGDYTVSANSIERQLYICSAIGITVLETPTADFDIDGICIGETTAFEDKSDPGVANTTYSWRFGDGDTSNATSPNHQYDVDVTTKHIYSILNLENVSVVQIERTKTSRYTPYHTVALIIAIPGQRETLSLTQTAVDMHPTNGTSVMAIHRLMQTQRMIIALKTALLSYSK